MLNATEENGGEGGQQKGSKIEKGGWCEPR